MLLRGIDWQTYNRLVRALERPDVRLTYDRGTLEIRTTSPQHERYKHLLGRLLEALTEELGLAIAGFGSMTCRRRRRRRGLEPDECYYIANEPQVRGRDRIDLRTDPPPDLAIEIDVTHSSLDRMSIYAALGVPEVWRFDVQTLAFNVLRPNGLYQVQATSLAFPFLTSAALHGFLGMRGQMDENALVRQFRAWVCQQQPPRTGTTAGQVP